MFNLSHIRLSILIVTAAIVAVTANAPARAEDPVTNMGPVAAHEPILAAVGSMRIIAFYTPGGDQCDFQAIVWDQTNDATAKRVRTSLNPGQSIHIDGDGNHSIDLQCGDHANNLAVVDSSEQVAAE
jgi:hypothetical protein